MAWIVVPKHQNLRGIEQLNGRIVRTIRLLPGMAMPTWEVTPGQRVQITQRSRDPHGVLLQPGDWAICDGIPDHYLRPFDPKSEPEVIVRELEAV
ncbi:MAG: hypothetical protein KF796_19485 [Ramlibacter sp.]|nr:hypothetical protein [Ramlibacter sp.]